MYLTLHVKWVKLYRLHSILHYFVFLVLNLEEVKIENEDLQAEVDQLRNQLVFAEENNARRIREIKTESSNEVSLNLLARSYLYFLVTVTRKKVFA